MSSFFKMAKRHVFVLMRTFFKTGFIDPGEDINESPPVLYIFIGGDTPSVFFEFPLSPCSDATRGGGEKPDTAPLGVCRSSPSPSGLHNLILVFLFGGWWGVIQ